MVAIATPPVKRHKTRGRKLGSHSHTPETWQYIKDNWRNTDDQTMGKHLGISAQIVQKLRNSVGLKRQTMYASDPNTTALICELFANGSTIVQISRIVAIKEATVSRMIENYWLYKTRSFDTVTLVLESKINEMC